MAGKPLTAQELDGLLKPKSQQVKEKPQTIRFPAPPQHGPLRYTEESSLCVVAGYWTYPENNDERVWKKSNACRSQTHYRVQGIPMCCTHALRKLNDMLVELGVEK